MRVISGRQLKMLPTVLFVMLMVEMRIYAYLAGFQKRLAEEHTQMKRRMFVRENSSCSLGRNKRVMIVCKRPVIGKQFDDKGTDCYKFPS